MRHPISPLSRARLPRIVGESSKHDALETHARMCSYYSRRTRADCHDDSATARVAANGEQSLDGRRRERLKHEADDRGSNQERITRDWPARDPSRSVAEQIGPRIGRDGSRRILRAVREDFRRLILHRACSAMVGYGDRNQRRKYSAFRARSATSTRRTMHSQTTRRSLAVSMAVC